MKKLLPLLSILTLLLLSVGCQAPTTAGISTRINAVSGNDEAAARFRYDDTRMGSSLQVPGAVTRQNPDGFIMRKSKCKT